MIVTIPHHIPLGDYEDARGRMRLSAHLDELTLTYYVVARDDAGATRRLRRHLPSLHEARRWATAHRNEQLRTLNRREETRSADPPVLVTPKRRCRP